MKLIADNNNAGIYLRLSKEDINSDFDSQSIQNQKSLITDYAAKNGFVIYDYYIDDGYSGGDFERPAFKRLIEDIENGNLNVVITKDISRLGRDFIETSHYIFKYFPEKNVRYISILDNFDTMKPNGMEDIIPFQTIINDMYLRDISKKIKSIRHNKMRAGLFVGSCVSYGYKRDDVDKRKFVVDEFAADVVRKIFNMKAAGSSNVMIARSLTNQGILPPNVYNNRNINLTYTTNLWKASTIASILKNEVYIGNLVQHKYDRINFRSKKKALLPRSEWIIVENNHEPIVSRNLFNYVNNSCNNLESVRKRKYDYVLKGLVVCAECGKKMVVRKEYRKKNINSVNSRAFFCCKSYVTYRNGVCSMHYFKEDSLNEIVFSKLRDLLKRYVSADKLVFACNDFLEKRFDKNKLINKIRNLQGRKKYINKAIERLYIDKVSGILSCDEFYSLREGLNNKVSSLEEQINGIENALTKFNDYYNNSYKIIDDFLNLDLNRRIYRGLIKKIEIEDNKMVRVFFDFFIG